MLTPRSRMLGGACALLAGVSAFACTRASSAPAPATASVSSAAAPAARPLPVDDRSLSKAIAAAFELDPALHSHRLTVTATKGTVRIAGVVVTLDAKNRAEAIVSEFKGADSLVNDVVVAPPSRPDSEIERDVREALRRDPAMRSAVLEVNVRGGVVTLTGTSDSYTQRRLMDDDAAKVPGVVVVHENVGPAQRIARGDAEIAADVRDTLADDGRLDGSHLAAQTSGRSVTLSGVVGSLAARRLAVEDASVSGVTTVDASGVRVDWRENERGRRARPPQHPDDRRIEAAVRRILRTDPRILPAEPTVAVKDGIVVLTGTVDSFAAERAAARDAGVVLGARRVDDDLSVVPAEKQTDAVIQQLAQRAIYNDAGAPDARAVQMSTRDGAVTLTGSLRSFREKQLLESDVEEIPGVVALHDDLTIQLAGPPASLADQIRSRLIENLYWDPRVGTGRVSVSVSAEGNTSLSGTVDSLGEAHAAEEDAFRAGATHVLNQIEVAGLPRFTPLPSSTP